MTSPTDDTRERLDALEKELESVKRREAQFRSKMVQEFLDRGERNTYLHVLHEERAMLRRREQEAAADLENLTRKLEAESERAAGLDVELGRVRRSWVWRLLGSLVPHERATVNKPSAVEGAVFTYYLHTTPFRVYRESAFTLRGWAWPQDGRAVTGIRVNVSGHEFSGRHGFEEPEVIARYGPQPANPKPGFEVTFDTPAGRQSLSLEAQIEGGPWRSIMRTSIWCEPTDPETRA